MNLNRYFKKGKIEYIETFSEGLFLLGIFCESRGLLEVFENAKGSGSGLYRKSAPWRKNHFLEEFIKNEKKIRFRLLFEPMSDDLFEQAKHAVFYESDFVKTFKGFV